MNPSVVSLDDRQSKFYTSINFQGLHASLFVSANSRMLANWPPEYLPVGAPGPLKIRKVGMEAISKMSWTSSNLSTSA